MRLASVPFSNFRFFFLRATVNVLGHSEAGFRKFVIGIPAQNPRLCHFAHGDSDLRSGHPFGIRVGLHATKFEASPQRNSLHI